MQLKQIGVIHSPYKTKELAPSQGRMKNDISEIEIFPKYQEGLKDIETATHLFVLFWCDRTEKSPLIVKTPWDSVPHGVFATRSPARPNPIALDIVELVERKGNNLIVRGMDALDNSPLLDIKPYTKNDCVTDARVTWIKEE